MVSIKDVNEIIYRQEIAKDLEDKILAIRIKDFAKKMITVRRYLTLVSKLYYKYIIEMAGILKLYILIVRQLVSYLLNCQSLI